MKTPRTSDFDPNAQEHSLKSSMDDFPVIQRPESAPAQDETRTTVPPVRAVRDVPLAASGKRTMKQRHPFDIYQDQLDELRVRALEDRMRGGPGSMSAMVREALDDFLAKTRAE